MRASWPPSWRFPGGRDGLAAALSFAPIAAALLMLVARTAAEAGHEVDLFIAGDGVGILRPETLDAGTGIGTGSMREHVDALVARGARFFLSGMSSKARGITAEGLGGLEATLAPPSKLVELTFEADRVLTY